MFEGRTFEAILQELLDLVPDDVDKREGSLIYNALAPVAAKFTDFYAELEVNENLSYADTATGTYLARRTAEYGVTKELATQAKRKGFFFDILNNPFDVAIGNRFSLGDLNYKVIEKLGAGEFVLECETTGTSGNREFGTLIPIEYIDGLARAELSDVLVPGEDDESDEDLRKRYYEAINEQPFGGNIADYKRVFSYIPGVGGVKVFPTWKGGGTVKCTIISSDFGPPSAEMLEDIQTQIDPVENSGEGLGLAPIGHRATVAGVSTVQADIHAVLTLDSGVTIGQIQREVEQIVSEYLLTLRKTWKNSERLVVRISQIEAKILGIAGVVDISSTKINGSEKNLTLDREQVPVLGVITIDNQQ